MTMDINQSSAEEEAGKVRHPFHRPAGVNPLGMLEDLRNTPAPHPRRIPPPTLCMLVAGWEPCTRHKELCPVHGGWPCSVASRGHMAQVPTALPSVPRGLMG